MRFSITYRSAALTAAVASWSLILTAQSFTVEPLVLLPEEVSESSGLIFLNDKLLTHNDSGGEANLYEVDPENGALLGEFEIEHATNVDWEDLAFDQQHIYIADIGNNNGERTDLKIYVLLLTDYFQARNNSISAEVINFSYEDQTDFNSNLQTNFDAEALISYGDSLYIFTKNWGDFHSNVYSLPKTPGDYSARRVGRINAEGLVSGAVYNESAEEIMLVGYTFSEPFLYRLSNFPPLKFDQGDQDRLVFELVGSFQIEGIEVINDTQYYLSSESNAVGNASLLQVVTDFLVSTENPFVSEIKIYPNPVRNVLNITGFMENELNSISIYNALGKQVIYLDSFNGYRENVLRLPVASMGEGLYQLRISSESRQIRHKLIVAR